MRIILALLLSVSAAWAGSFATNSVNYQSIASATVIGKTNSASTARVPQHEFVIAYGGIGSTNTNDFRVEVQLSLDQANWTTVATYRATTTNGTVETFSPSFAAIQAYMRVSVTTSNTMSASVTTLRATP